MKTTTTARRASIRSPREIAIHRFVHSIRINDRQGAHDMWEHFQKKGERLSREIVAAYRLLV